MKRAMVYLIAISALLTALLSGCGEQRTNQQTTPPTAAPETTILPETMMPDESDGVVGDTDGIITEDDNGGSLSESDGAAASGEQSEGVEKKTLRTGNAAGMR